MIYLIGGPPRTGKTTLAKMLLREKGIPFVPTDALIHMLKHAAGELGITDKVSYTEKAARFEPFLDFFIKYVQHAHSDYTVEGDAFLPKQVGNLQQKHTMRACFLGLSEITLEDILQYDLEGWVADLLEEDQQGLSEYLVEMSNFYEEEAKKYRFAYFDVPTDFKAVLKQAKQYLLVESKEK